MQFINWRIFSLFLSILPVTQIPMWLSYALHVHPTTKSAPDRRPEPANWNPIHTLCTSCFVVIIVTHSHDTEPPPHLTTDHTLNHLDRHSSFIIVDLWPPKLSLSSDHFSLSSSASATTPLSPTCQPFLVHFKFKFDCPFPFIISIGPSNSLSHFFLLSPPSKLSDWLTTCCWPPKPNDTITTTDPTHSSTLSPDLYLSFNCRT